MSRILSPSDGVEYPRIARTAARVALASAGALGVLPMLAQAVVPQTSDPAKLPAVTVTAQKEAQSLQAIPGAVTAVTHSFLENAGIRYVNDAAMFAPNSYITEFSARKLSNPRFRGIGSSPNNPGVTTYLDGVPQLNANTSSLELIDVDQIEFVRGSQGALFGRNTLGGLINLTSARPALDRSSGGAIAGVGDHGFREARFNVTGPLTPNEMGFSLAAGYSEREGYATNSLTGRDVDGREAAFGKGQFLWQLSKEWEARVILSGERARDGDYRLNDLLKVRANPTVVTRDFEGFANRDILAPTLLLTGRTGATNVVLTTGAVWWKTLDVTDLDYTAAPLAQRNNAEKGRQFTQELRFSSAAATGSTLTWQAGAFLFVQDYDQDAANFFPSPAFLGYPVGTPAFRSYSVAALEDRGLGVFGQATYKLQPAFSISLGLRADFEKKEADLATFTVPAGLGTITRQNLDDDFGEVSPHLAATYQLAPDQTGYGSIARGYKAGGFNAASPVGTERFDREFSWNYEAGYKATWLDQRLRTNVAVFYSRWNDLQLNVPTAAPGQFYVANVGAASSRGVEVELAARVLPGWDVFAGGGRMAAKFRHGSHSDGVDVGGKRLPFSPDYTVNGGTQYSFNLDKEVTAFVRGEVTAVGKFYYSDQNVRSQGAYALTNLRLGVRGRQWSIEGWMRNAFDEAYVPVAISYSFAPSGFVGESGAPQTMGVSVGFRF